VSIVKTLAYLVVSLLVAVIKSCINRFAWRLGAMGHMIVLRQKRKLEYVIEHVRRICFVLA
jgi:hypothetical protein